MIKVNNQKILRQVSASFLRGNGKRNVLAILAIILTTLLFTSLFMGTGSLLLSNQATLMKQTMSSSHANAQDVSDADAERAERYLKKDSDVKAYGKGLFLGVVANQQLPFSTELRAGDSRYAESFNAMLEVGRMPTKEDEIAASSLLLDACGVPQEIGQTITLTWEQDARSGTLRTDTFTVSGIIRGDKAVLSQLAFVSPQYAAENRHIPTAAELADGNCNGAWDLTVWYRTLFGIQNKTDRLNEAIHFSTAESAFRVSPAFDYGGEDSFSFRMVAVFVGVIVLAGYLIIYNIFSLSVLSDIKTYALLKNVGTTGKQLKKIVRMQAFSLCAVGIPLGLILGYGAGKMMAPSLVTGTELGSSAQNTMEVVVAAHPLIFLLSALMALITVYLSSLKACRMVDRVSPIEALHTGEATLLKRKELQIGGASWFQMAVGNLRRNAKSGWLVMLSIALSIITVNLIYMLVTGYHFEEYQNVFTTSDFQIDQMTSYAPTTNFNGVTPEIRAMMDACDTAAQTGYVYYSGETHEMEPHLQKVMQTYAQKNRDGWNMYEQERWEQVQETNCLSVHFLGISKAVFDRLEWPDGAASCSWEDFQTGRYMLIDTPDQHERTHTLSYYAQGEKVRMTFRNGASAEYEVGGEAIMPYALDYPYADIFYLTILVPEDEYIRVTGNDCAMYGILDAEDGKLTETDRYLREHLPEDGDAFHIVSVLDMQESFRRYLSNYYTIGGFLVLVLTLIGVMNFYNTMMTMVISRKRELTLLEIVGMTRRQVIRMLVTEGICYAAGAFLLAVLVVSLWGEDVLTNTLGMSFYYHAETTILPSVLLLPALLLLAVWIPYTSYKKLEAESLMERIRSI